METVVTVAEELVRKKDLIAEQNAVVASTKQLSFSPVLSIPISTRGNRYHNAASHDLSAGHVWKSTNRRIVRAILEETNTNTLPCLRI